MALARRRQAARPLVFFVQPAFDRALQGPDTKLGLVFSQKWEFNAGVGVAMT
jgi:hypothetical protein